jgi:hypothetical protein
LVVVQESALINGLAIISVALYFVIIMDHADDGVGDDDVFAYMGGRAPRHVTHVRVHRSVTIITRSAFENCRNLVSIEMHDGVEIIKFGAFFYCTSLRGIKLPGVRVIEESAFCDCTALAEVDFGDKLETIGQDAFNGCTSLRNVKLPKVRFIGNGAFLECRQLTDVETSDNLERIGNWAFQDCRRLRRIAIPLKTNMFDGDFVFISRHVDALSQVDLVGGIHNTISSLILDSWRNEMNEEINRINQVIPNTRYNMKTVIIRQWMERVTSRIYNYKVEHYKLLKEFTTLLELALWKVKLDEKEDVENAVEIQKTKKAKIDADAARQELRVTSGANIVIKNVLPFLVLE